MSLSQLFLYEINKIRTNPQTYVEKFEKICNELSNVKRKKNLFDELTSFLDLLKNAPAVPPLKLSNELSKVANLRVESILSKNSFEDDDFLDIANSNLSGFDEIYHILERFSDNPTSFFTELLIDPKDEDKTNRKLIFDPNLQYLGLNDLDEGKKHNIIILVFTDDIDNISNSDKPKNEQILDFINVYRCDTRIAAPDFEEVLIEARKKNAPQKHIDDLQDLLQHCYDTGMLAPLELNDTLSALAENFLNKPLEAANKKLVEAFAKTQIKNFNHLYGGYCIQEEEPEFIIKNILTSDDSNNARSSKGAILFKAIKKIGIAFNSKDNTTVIIAVDNFEEGEEEPFVDNLIGEINKLRTNPKVFSQNMMQGKEKNKWISAKYIASLKNASAEIAKRKAIKAIELNQILNEVSLEYIEHSEHKKGLYREEEEILTLRLQHFCSGFKLSLQVIEQGGKNATDVLINMIISEKDGVENLNILFNEKTKYIGIANSIIQSKPSTVLILTDEVKDLIVKPFIDSFKDEVNHIRTYPKSYIKIFRDIHESPVTDQINDNAVRIKDEALMIIPFLKSSRTYGALTQNEYLTKAAEARLAMFIQNHYTIQHASQEDLRVFLSDFCTGNNIYEQFTGKGFDSARSFVCSILLNIHDNDKIAKNTIFSQKFFNFGVAYDPNSSIVVAILADHANPPKVNNEPIVHRTWDRLQRPTFTKDEIDQLRRDFQSLDPNNQGYIYPNTILTFMNMVENFKDNNPFYFEAMQNLNTVENNETGITFEVFQDAISKVIKLKSRDQWATMYDIFVKGSDKGVFDYKLFYGVLKGLNYDYSETEIKEIIFKISHDGFDLENIEQENEAKEKVEKEKAEKPEKVEKGEKPSEKEKEKGKNIVASQDFDKVSISRDKFVQIILSIESNWQVTK